MFLKIWFILALRVVVEVKGAHNGTEIEGETSELLRFDDYPEQIPSLIQNPNVRTKPTKFRKEDDCTDELLRKVMHEHITDAGMSESKRAIHNAAKRDFEGSWSIICAPCPFSYLAHTKEFCVHSRHGITCLLYRDG